MAGNEEVDIPGTGAVFTFGRSRFADNVPSHFFIRNDPVVEIACGDEHTAVVCRSDKGSFIDTLTLHRFVSEDRVR
ncbi:Uncharacterized protein GBIM_18881, partial [Gryllus bimaculatus]